MMKKYMLKAFNVISAVVLAFAIVLTLFSMMVTDQAIAAWDGTIGTTFASGSGTEASPYKINSEIQMGYFLNQIKKGVTYEGKFIYLGKDLNMTGGTWDVGGYTFQGTLDGRGYTVTAECAFLGTIGENATVRGLNYNCTAVVDRSIFCLENAGNINNCVVKGDADGGSYVGMFCSTNSGTIRKCGAIGSAKAFGDDASAYAGMVAYNYSSGVIEDCYAAITASASHTKKYNYNHYGPIVGYKNGTVTNCFYDKTLFTATTQYGTGVTTAELKSSSILGTLRGDLPAYCDWTIDAALGGYPRLAHLAHNYRSYVTSYDGQELVAYDGTYLYVTLSKSTTYSSAEIYYTTDPNETNPSNFTKYTSGSIRLSGDTVITTAVKYNSSFGALTRQRFVSLPGAGTENSPYQISTKSQLTMLNEFPAAHFELVADLTFTAADFATGGLCPGGWPTVPNFSGKLCGNGHAITGLQGKLGGLVGTNNGTICDLRIVDHRLYGPNNVGAVANSNGYQTGVVTRCYTRSAYSRSSMPATPGGPVSSVGGVVGYNSGTVSYCRNDGVVAHINNGSYITGELGGIVGYGDASNCVNTGQLIMINNATLENIYVGGITGGGDARNCMSNCDVYLDVRADYPFSVAGLAGGLSYNWAYNSVAGINVTRVGNTAQGHTVYAYACGVQSGATDCYRYQTYNLPEDCPNLTFGVGGNWWISNDGLVPQGVMSADGHAWRLTSSQILPTCAANGDAVLKCDICGQTSLQTIQAVGHKFTTYTSNEDGTCVADGTETAACDRECGYSGNTHTRTDDDSIDPNGHTFQDGVCTLCGIIGGQCGDELYWSLKEGKLTIYGTGAMYDYQYNTMPWYEHRESITSVTVEAGATYLGNNAFRDMTALTSVSIDASVTEIGYSAFEGCSALSAIALPANMTVIADSLFHSCTSLTTITLPTKLESIGVNAFNSCAMTSISLPSSLKEIDHYAFAGCSRLKSIYFPSSLTSIGGGVFQNCSSLTSVTVPASVTSMGTGVFSRCSALTSATINANITSLGNGTFELCSSLQTVKLPESLQSIGSNVFSSCINLTSVNIPTGVTSIGSAAFSGCSKLPSVTLPSGLKTIESNTFYGCRALTEIVIPDGVTTIGMNAFSGCSGLTYAVLPESLLTINARGFLDCDALTDIYFGGTETAWTDIGSEVPVAERIHYECTDPDGHWLTVVTDPSCTKIGYTSDLCLCDPCYEKDVRNELAATGHAWVDADCLVAKTCSVCGETEGEPLSPNLEHTWAAATCTLPETCSVCNATQGEELGHDWLSATCTAAAPCSRCDATYGSPLGHDWKAADCENPETCSRCGNTQGAALGHRIVQEGTAMVDPLTVNNTSAYPFILKNGSYYSTNKTHSTSADIIFTAEYACTVKVTYSVSSETTYDKLIIWCNTSQKASIAGTTMNQTLTLQLNAGDIIRVRYYKDGSISKNNDEGWFSLEYDNVQVTTKVDIPAADVEAECTEEVTCDYCDTIVKPVTEHSWEAATCTTVAKCTVCGATDGDVLGHDWQDADCDTPETCSRCGTTQGDPLGHDWQDADCDTPETCSRCDETQGEALGHRVVEVRETWVDPVSVQNTSAAPFEVIDGTYYSTNHTDNSSSQIKITADYACSLTLHYGVSSETNYDKLFVLHNNIQKDMISGSVTNKTLTLQLAVGDTVIVRYTKDISQSRYDDRGWVTLEFDQILLSSTNVDVPAEEVEADCVTPVICDYCQTEVKPVAGHKWQQATCITTETCEVCDETQGEVDLRNHNFADGVCTWCGRFGGQCGESLYWLMEDADSLIIYGSGDMDDYTSGGSAPWYTHRNAITDVTVEGGASIGDYAFYNLKNAQTVSVADSVKTIGDYAFYACTKMTAVDLPDTMTEIGMNAFQDCRALTSVTIPDGVSVIMQETFLDCTSLTSVSLPDSVTEIRFNAFQNCGKLTDIILPDSLTRMAEGVFRNCTSLTSIEIPADVDAISFYTFAGCTALETVVISGDMNGIDICAFEGCTALKSINIPDSVTSLGVQAFANCSSLTNMELPADLISMGSSVFAYCSNLTSVEIPEGVDAIPDFAFGYCMNLTRVTIPETVTSIDSEAFVDCSNLEDVYFGGTEEAWAALGENVPVATYVHYEIDNSTGHWYMSIVDPTCTEGGYTCEACLCGYEKNVRDEQPSLGHTGGTATCTQQAVCTRCGESYGEALDHDWTEADCENPKTCIRCYATQGEKLGHTGGTATCAQLATCVNCGNPYGELADHIWQPATCLAPKTCEVCNAIEGEITDHIWQPATCDAPKTCIICSVTQGEKLEHNWLAATCQSPTRCSLCGVTQGQSVTYGHIFANGVCTECGVPGGQCGEDLYWVLEGETGLVIYGTGAMYDYDIGKAPWLEHTDTITYVTVKEGVTTIGTHAFESMINMSQVNLPDSLTKIGEFAFAGSTGLQHVTISANVQSVGAYAFYGSNIQYVIIEKGVQKIESNAFAKCPNLEIVALNDGLASIGTQAFYDCDKLWHLVIPASVTEFGDDIFDDCQKMEDVYYGGSVEQWPDGENMPYGRVHYNTHSSDGHWMWNRTVEPDCTNGGYTRDTCPCGHEMNIRDEVPALGHDWLPADCDAPKTCSRCGTTEGNPAGHTWIEAGCTYPKTCNDCGITEGEPLDHDWQAATCYAPQTCSRCYATRGEKLTHTGGTATCNQQAICTNCGSPYGELADHSWQPATCTAPETCKNCSSIQGASLGHTGGTATCTQQAVCTRCGKGYGEVSGQHQFDAIWHSGDVGHWHECTVCGTKDTVKPHNPGPAATESAAQTCTDCGYVIQQKLEHVHDLKQVTYKAAKCEAEGNIEYYTCVCGQWFREAYAQTLITDHSSVILPATGHKHVKTSTVPATCNAAGYSIYTCTCGDSYEADHVSALGHTGGTATCQELARCTRCGERYGEKPDHVFDFASPWLPGDATGHWHECVNCGIHEPPIPHIPGPEATEDTAQTCTECGYVITPALGHTHKLTHKSFVEPTCTKNGSKEYFECTCGKWFADGEGINEITDHSSVVIPAKGHSHSQQVTKPTCTEDGYTTYTCSCGDTYTADIVKAPGHQYDEGVCTECGAVDETYVPKFEISFANMTLGNSLAMNFAFEQGHQDNWNGCYAQIVKEYADGRSDKVVTIPYSQWGTAKISGVQHFTLKFDGVAAKEMSDSVYVTIYDASGKAISKVWEDSVRSYAMRTLNNPSSNLETQIMIVDLLNYGAAAQSNFGYNTADLANNQLSAAQKALATKTVKATDGRVKGENYKGTNLGLESQILMRMAFGGTTEDMYAIISFTSHTGKVNNIRVDGSEFGTSGVIVIDEIVIADGRQPVTITVYNADGTVYGSATDSLESYIARMSDAGALYEMILKFSDSAYNFFH